MKGDSKAIEYLNKALRHELTAVNQYWLHYRMLDNWGYRVVCTENRIRVDGVTESPKLAE